MTDYCVQEQEMEIEALQAILMDEFQEIDYNESGLNTTNRCFQITLSPLLRSKLSKMMCFREYTGGWDMSDSVKLMPGSALAASKEKRLTGRQWFESARAAGKQASAIAEGSEDEDEEDIDLDDSDFDDNEEDMLEHYLAK